MAGSDSNPDLERFRQQWRKELNEKCRTDVSDESDLHKLQSSSSNFSGGEHDSTTYRVNHFSDYNLPPVNAELARIPLQDDNSRDGYEINTFKPHNKVTSGEASGEEYFPFKILTQFLNEAPQRLESKHAKQILNSPPQTLSKKRYFQETPGSLCKASKISKGDECNDNAKKEGGTATEEKQMLDIFLADLEEINEIPFFDMSVPREVAIKIFHNLDMRSLCNCSQVSRSWHSLADDELLWFGVYNKLGLGATDAHLHVSDGNDWKDKVRKHMERKQLLDANWKARIGKPYQLSYVQGGVLCAVHSHGPIVVAGYTNCNIRSWDTGSGDTCTYSASNTALILDEIADDDEEGLCRTENSVQHIQTTGEFIAASYIHGFVDVWNSRSGTGPVHTILFNNRNINGLAALSSPCLKSSSVYQGSMVVAAAQGTRVKVSSVSETEGQAVADFDAPKEVKQLLWIEDTKSQHHANLLVTNENTVGIRRIELSDKFYCSQSQNAPEMTEVHNVYWAPITAVALRQNCQDLAVGFNIYAGAAAQIKVNLYKITTRQLTTTLTGHTWVISSIHLPETLPSQLVTGSGDRKIRLYDLRAASFPMQTLAGHSARVTSAEMDEWKVVSADEAGFVYVWDQRMSGKLWDLYNRHPVDYCHFEERLLIIGNIPIQKFPLEDAFDKVSSLRYRGTVQVYDFLANHRREDIPSICLSGYDEPEAYDYNIKLAMPYD